MADLTHYRAKRDFEKTDEPKGVLAQKIGHRYLIQKHAATNLHYDLRLELDGVLKSWAVPKGPSYDPKDKRLAVEVEDHPVDYGTFEGTIPEGQYGGGSVMLWDRGTWEPVGDARDGIKNGKLVFKLYGERLKGEWTLVRFNDHEGKRNLWFLIKHRDGEAIEGDSGRFARENATSIATGRTMTEIAAADGVAPKSDHPETVTAANAGRTRFVLRTNGKFSPNFPGFIPPQLATLSTALPNGKDWVHEIKFDGYRMLAYIENGAAHLISRNDKDWTESFKPIADFIALLPVKNAIVDGEVVAIGRDNKSDFSELKNALSAGTFDRMQYYAFDLLFLDGADLRELPLLDRKTRLKALVDRIPDRAKLRVLYSDHFDDDDGNLFQGVCSMHLEGVISKRIDAPYRSDRSKTWLKTKCIHREEFVIGGFTLPTDGAKRTRSLLLGYYEADELRYAGRVGTGWNDEESIKLRQILDDRATSECPFQSVTVEGRRNAKWVKPELVCEVEFTEWTPDGHLRHPSYKGLRKDKDARDVVRDRAEPVAVAVGDAAKEAAQPPVKKATSRSFHKAGVSFGDIAISHPERVIYPESHLTKEQLADYYFSVADHILPHLVDRPISMLRCPDGASKSCFYQRHLGMGKSPYLHEVNITVKGTSRTYLMIKDVNGLMSLVQWGVIEIHPWQCTAADLERPDRLIFDLDPDPELHLERLIEAAREVRQRLEELEIKAFLKTTGGKGLHVVAPLVPDQGWDAIKTFAHSIANSMVADSPDHYVSKMSKAARKGRIFVDYLRNDVTSTAIAPLSARARTGATVSTPLGWEELRPTLNVKDFTVESVPRLLDEKKKPWADFFKIRQKIDAKMLRAL